MSDWNETDWQKLRDNLNEMTKLLTRVTHKGDRETIQLSLTYLKYIQNVAVEEGADKELVYGAEPYVAVHLTKVLVFVDREVVTRVVVDIAGADLVSYLPNDDGRWTDTDEYPEPTSDQLKKMNADLKNTKHEWPHPEMGWSS